MVDLVKAADVKITDESLQNALKNLLEAADSETTTTGLLNKTVSNLCANSRGGFMPVKRRTKTGGIHPTVTRHGRMVHIR